MNYDVNQADAIKMLQAGKVGILPTDTVYGLVARAEDQDATERLYALKQRQSKPGTIIAADVNQLIELGIPKRYLTVVEQYWPNPVSVIVPAPLKLAYLYQGKGALALRVPADDIIQRLLQQTGPLITTSANRPGQPPATTIAKAQAYFGNTVDFYAAGGDLSDRQPSTIIRIVDDIVEVIREGSIVIDEKGQIIR